jgi:hypothetical protein
MMSGGDVALRGFLVQTLIALLEALKDDPPWTSVTLEPNLESEKVDILWVYQDGTKKALQVKSSKNPFSKKDVEQWAADLQESKAADRYELCLVGPTTPTVAKLSRVGDVVIPTPKNLDLPAFKSDAAHRLHGLLEKWGWAARSAGQLDDLISLLIENLASGSVNGQTLSREGLAKLLYGWISRRGGGVHVLRVFLACSQDAQAERVQLDEIVTSLTVSKAGVIRCGWTCSPGTARWSRRPSLAMIRLARWPSRSATCFWVFSLHLLATAIRDRISPKLRNDGRGSAGPG